jgi:hypothetical protein
MNLICWVFGHKKPARLDADEVGTEIEQCARCGVVIGIRITHAGHGWPRDRILTRREWEADD